MAPPPAFKPPTSDTFDFMQQSTPVKQRNLTPLSPAVREGEQIEQDAADNETAEVRYHRLLGKYRDNEDNWWETLHKSDSKMADLETENTENKRRIKKLETDNASLMLTLKSQGDEFNAMKQQLQQVTQRQKASRVEEGVVAALRKNVKDLSSEYTDLKAEREKDRQQVDKLQALNGALHTQIDNYQQQLHDTSALMEENSALRKDQEAFNERLEEILGEVGFGLTVHERLAQLQQIKNSADEPRASAASGRRTVSGSSLAEDMEGISDEGSETEVEDQESMEAQETMPPAVPEPQVIIKHVPAEPEIIYKERIKYVHEPITTKAALAALSPWLWLLLLLIGLVVLAWSGAMARELSIWRAANSLAYDRFMGQSEETWTEWVVLGVDRMVGVGRSVYG